MQRSRFDGHVASIKSKFDELDKNKNGELEFEEIKDFLKQRRPEAKTRDLKWWFQEYDKGKRGKMSFKDFSDLVHREELTATLVEERQATAKSAPDLPTAGQAKGAHQTDIDALFEDRNNTATEEEGLDWEVVQNVFIVYAGSDKVLQGNEFARLCRDCDLYDEEFFTPGHAELVFGKFTEANSTVMKKQGFRKALIAIAAMKGVSVTYFRGDLKKRAEQIQSNQSNQSNQSKRRPSVTSTLSTASTKSPAGSLPGSLAAERRPSVNSTATAASVFSPAGSCASRGSLRGPVAAERRPSMISPAGSCGSRSSLRGSVAADKRLNMNSAPSVASTTSPASPTSSQASKESLRGSIAVALRTSERKPARGQALKRSSTAPSIRANAKPPQKLEPLKSLKLAGGKMVTSMTSLKRSCPNKQP